MGQKTKCGGDGVLAREVARQELEFMKRAELISWLWSRAYMYPPADSSTPKLRTVITRRYHPAEGRR